MRRVNRSERTAGAICLVLLFAGLFWLCWLFPLTGDDWYREALGMTLHSPLDLARTLVQVWSTTNARVMGNILAYTAGSRPLVRELMRALLTLALAAALARVTGLRGWRGILLCTALLLALPREMFCQIYPWAAGFFNYLPPAAMLLACLALAEPVLEGETLRESGPRAAALFLLGFGQQLFVENATLCALCASGLLLVWYWWERRRLSPCLLVFFLGCLLGAALLFASPAYRNLGTAEGAYHMGGTLSGLLATARENVPEVARYYILKCPVLYWPLTLLALLYWGNSRRTPLDNVLAAVLVLGCLGLAWGGFRPVVMAGVWALACTAALWRWSPDRPTRAKALFLWLMAAAAAAPLLFVTPIGPRCLFLSYVLLLGTAGVLFHALGPEDLTGPVRTLIPIGAAAGILCFYLSVFWPLHQLELTRTQILEEALSAGASQAVLPAFEDGGYLWEADSDYKMELVYFRETPGDLAIRFVPRSEWEGLT